MRQGIKSEHVKNGDGVVTGGYSETKGAKVSWQDGPLGNGENRIESNGAFVEDIIDIARDRLKAFQDSPFACRENAVAITKLEEAMMWCAWRTADRESREVEGTHKV